ncbi:MAG: stage II sporulation protein M [Candidatus Micrarchaeia archaeon]
MVLESLLSPENAERNPWEVFFLAFVFVTVGVWATDFLGGNCKGMLVNALIAIPAVPVILNLFNYEERSIEEGERFLGSRTLARHLPVVVTMVLFFVGMIFAFTFWYLALPPQKAASIFGTQIEELKTVSGVFGGYATYATQASFQQAFETIFLHNLGVLALIIAFSVLYGAGAVFVLIWNASIIGVFIGNFAKQFVLHAAPEYSIIAGVSAGFLGLVPHGTFELVSYLLGALGAGILSSAIIRKSYEHKTFSKVTYDIAKLVAWAVVVLAIGAGIEAYNIAGGI